MRFTVLLLISLSACGYKASAEIPNVMLGRSACKETLRLEVDSLFNRRERVEIIKALTNWRVASNNQLCFKIFWRDTTKDKETFGSDGKFAIYSCKRPWQIKVATKTNICPKRNDCLGITIWESGGQVSDIFILTTDVSFVRATIEHELGHMFGLKHSTVYDSIMLGLIRRDKTINNIDRKNINCLIKTQTFLQGTDDCI